MRACHKNRDGNWSPIFNLCRQVPISSAFIWSAAIKTGSSSRDSSPHWVRAYKLILAFLRSIVSSPHRPSRKKFAGYRSRHDMPDSLSIRSVCFFNAGVELHRAGRRSVAAIAVRIRIGSPVRGVSSPPECWRDNDATCVSGKRRHH
jgi:hypothetical protein